MKRSLTIFLAAVLVTVLFILKVNGLDKGETAGFHEGRSIKALIHTSSTKQQFGQIAYHYDLLHRFASDMGAEIEVSAFEGAETPIDSLLSGRADILVCGIDVCINNDSIWSSQIIDSNSVWLVAAAPRQRSEEIDEWLYSYIHSAADDSLRVVFSRRMRPHKMVSRGETTGYISPYDNLIRSYSDSLDWDWRLLAALIYQESRFNINAGSPKGARGLMQLMPRIRKRYGCENYLDPEQNIMAGTRLLARLEKRLSDISLDKEERTKFILASYNAGDGRIRQCIEESSALGADISSWDSIVSALSQTEDMENADSTSSSFNFNETVSFVKKVLSYYDCFRQICPE